MAISELKQNLLALGVIDKIRLAEFLLDNIDKCDEEVEKTWINESKDRYKAYKEGQVKAISIEEIRSRYEI